MPTIDYDVTFEPIHKHRRQYFQYPHVAARFDYPTKPKRLTGCKLTGKVRFKSHADALARAGEILSLPNPISKTFRAYACQYCNGWHLTSK